MSISIIMGPRRLSESSYLLRSAAKAMNLRRSGQNVLDLQGVSLRAFCPERLAHDFIARSRDDIYSRTAS
jgi:hypothetical protein